MPVMGRELLGNIGGEILNPREGGGAYDAMLSALHDVIDVHKPTPTLDDKVSLTVMRDYYRHLKGTVEGATIESYTDLLELAWSDMNVLALGGTFKIANVSSSNPLYSLQLNRLSGHAELRDYENGKLRRVGQLSLLHMTSGITPQLAYFPDNGYLSQGYVSVPRLTRIDIRDEDGEMTGDSVRRALDPYEEQLASIAVSLAHEADLSQHDKVYPSHTYELGR